jgi:hypothetical protein
MTTDHIFLGFMGAVGIAAGAILIAMPETRDLRVSPYFWVLIAMALFEVSLFAFWRGVPSRTISNGARRLRARSRHYGRDADPRRLVRTAVLTRI